MGELTTFVKHLYAQYKRIESNLVSFHLIEAGDRLLPEQDPDLVDYATNVFKRRGVRIWLQTPVQSVEPPEVRLSDGKPFIYNTMGTLALLGNYTGIGKVMGVKIRGFLAWWLWRTYHPMQMPRFDRKLRLIVDWTISLFFANDIVELAFLGRFTTANWANPHPSHRKIELWELPRCRWADFWKSLAQRRALLTELT